MEQLSTSNFSKNMVRLMKDRGISYIDLERRTGIGRGGLNEYANGKHKVSLDYAIKIARALGKSLDEMLISPNGEI